MSTKGLGLEYYTALGRKDMDAVKKLLHPHIQFSDPQEKVIGRDEVLAAAESFTKIFNALTIYTAFHSEDQAMIVYDVSILGLTKNLRAASLLSFQDGLISGIELIYDTGCFK
ncbi:MAG: nuclear transport factor 2 family protein [Chlamydiia bacterium]